MLNLLVLGQYDCLGANEATLGNIGKKSSGFTTNYDTILKYTTEKKHALREGKDSERHILNVRHHLNFECVRNAIWLKTRNTSSRNV